jgi:hypothetical protein
MTTLAEIETAADALSPDQKEQLLLFLAIRLRSHRTGIPEPREFSREQIAGWIAEDEAEMKKFREGK